MENRTKPRVLFRAKYELILEVTHIEDESGSSWTNLDPNLTLKSEKWTVPKRFDEEILAGAEQLAQYATASLPAIFNGPFRWLLGVRWSLSTIEENLEIPEAKGIFTRQHLKESRNSLIESWTRQFEKWLRRFVPTVLGRTKTDDSKSFDSDKKRFEKRLIESIAGVRKAHLPLKKAAIIRQMGDYYNPSHTNRNMAFNNDLKKYGVDLDAVIASKLKKK